MNKEDNYDRLYKELVEIAKELESYYDIDKIKSYSVYIWTKGDGIEDFGENVFDIMENEIVYYVKDHIIIKDAIPIIKKIQSKLKEIRLSLGR